MSEKEYRHGIFVLAKEVNDSKDVSVSMNRAIDSRDRCVAWDAEKEQRRQEKDKAKIEIQNNLFGIVNDIRGIVDGPTRCDDER